MDPIKRSGSLNPLYHPERNELNPEEEKELSNTCSKIQSFIKKHPSVDNANSRERKNALSLIEKFNRTLTLSPQNYMSKQLLKKLNQTRTAIDKFYGGVNIPNAFKEAALNISSRHDASILKSFRPITPQKSTDASSTSNSPSPLSSPVSSPSPSLPALSPITRSTPKISDPLPIDLSFLPFDDAIDTVKNVFLKNVETDLSKYDLSLPENREVVEEFIKRLDEISDQLDNLKFTPTSDLTKLNELRDQIQTYQENLEKYL